MSIYTIRSQCFVMVITYRLYNMYKNVLNINVYMHMRILAREY